MKLKISWSLLKTKTLINIKCSVVVVPGEFEIISFGMFFLSMAFFPPRIFVVLEYLWGGLSHGFCRNLPHVLHV